MGYNFRPVERDQDFLMPPSLRDWLPADDLAWLVLDVVDQVDLSAIRARYRDDGWGAPAFDPAMMTALLLYAYANGERSSRRIERLCRRDIAFRVITANQAPDHATIARFRVQHEAALAALFGDILRLCRAAGLGTLGLVALDGTKIEADAARDANRGADQLDAEVAAILAEAAAADAEEDALHGRAERGDGLPPGLADRAGRLERLAAARRQLEGPRHDRSSAPEVPVALSPTGRRRPAPKPRTRANTTDPDSRLMHSPRGGSVQAYNAQLAATSDGLVVAAELTQQPVDVDQLLPVLVAVLANAAGAGFGTPVGTLLADGGYWSEANMASLSPGAPELLVPPGVGRPRQPGEVPTRRPRPAMEHMAEVLATERGAGLYRRRQAIVEPVFGQIKGARGIRRFQRRGFDACVAEWRLICTTHNLLKLWRSRLDRGPAQPPPRRRGPRRAAAQLPA